MERLAAIAGASTLSVERFLHSALMLERSALDWVFDRAGRRGILRRTAGRLVLRAADVYYHRELAKLARGPSILPPSAFDPNHILMLIGTLGPGGSERQLVTTLLGLKQTGHERLAVVCRYLDEPWQRFFLPELQRAGIEVSGLVTGDGEPLPLTEPELAQFSQRFALLPAQLGEIRDLAAEFVRRRPGIVHLWLDDINCKAGLAALAVGVPRIVISTRSVTPHNFVFYHQYMKTAYRLLVRSDRTVLLNNSRAGAADYACWLGMRPRDVVVLPNGFCFDRLPDLGSLAAARHDLRARLGWSDGALVLGTISRLTEEKRPDLWVDTALRLANRRSDMRFLIAGDGPLRGPLEERVARSDLAGRFWFAGYQRDTTAVLSAMDIVMLTSRKEGLPNVLVEAQALGIPVVSTDAGGARETFLPGETGILVERDDVEALADAVLTLLEDPAERKRWGMRGAEYVRGRFGAERMIRETRAVYGRGARGGGSCAAASAGGAGAESPK